MNISVHDILHESLFEIAGTPISSVTVITFLLILLMTFSSSRMLQRGMSKAASLKGLQGAGSIQVTSRLVHYTIMAVGFGVALQTIGIDLGAFFAAGAVFAVGLGFAMQNIAQNFVSGVILLLERSIKPGDVLEVQGKLVRVEELGIRSTVARSRDDEELIIPNTELVQSVVKNFTHNDRSFRIRAEVSVSYETDLDIAQTTLMDIATTQSTKHPDSKPTVSLLEMADSGIVFEVSVWSIDPWNVQRDRSDLLMAIWRGLRDASIEIPYPQLDIHADEKLLVALKTS